MYLTQQMAYHNILYQADKTTDEALMARFYFY